MVLDYICFILMIINHNILNFGLGWVWSGAHIGIVWGISLLSLVWIVLIFIWVVGIFRVCLGEKIFLRPKPSLLSCEKILWIDQKERMPYEVTISGGAPWGFRLSGGAPSEEGIRVR